MSKSDRLQNNLTELYMDIASSFYFEGSDEGTEHDEYAPEFVNKVIDNILEVLPDSYHNDSAESYEDGLLNGNDEALGNFRSILNKAKLKSENKEDIG